MAEIARVESIFTADTSGFVSNVNNAAQAVQKFSSTAASTSKDVQHNFSAMEKNLSSKMGSIRKVFGILGVGAITAYTVKLGKDSVAAATAAGLAQDRLRRLLLTTGGATEAQIAILNQHAKALEATTVVTGENITTVQSQLATFDLHGSTIARLTPAILDYVVAEKGATASAGEFKSMTNGLAQALNGQFKSLTSIGFVLDDATKKMISNGTETERAAGIVKVLNSTYKDFASTGARNAATEQVNLAKAIGQAKEELGRGLLPVVQEVQSALASKLVPALQKAQQQFLNQSAIRRYFEIIKVLGENIVDFARGISTILAPIIQRVLIPAFKALVGAIGATIKILGSIGRFIEKNAQVVSVLIDILIIAGITYGAYRTQILLSVAAQKIQLALTTKLTGAVGALQKAQKLLNLTMAFNPIGLIVAAVALLVAGFVTLWKRSETFRKGIISIGKVALPLFAHLVRALGRVAEAMVNNFLRPIRLLLMGLAQLPQVGKYAQAALDFLDKGINGVGNTADKAADSIDNFAKDLDRFNKTKVKDPFDEERRAGRKESKLFPDLSKLGEAWNTGAGGVADDIDKGNKKIQGALERMNKLVQNFNDYMLNDFAKDMSSSVDSARDAIGKSLDLLEDIFEEKAKSLSGKALKNLQNQFKEINSRIRSFIPEAEMLAGKLQQIEAELSAAESDLERALESRAGAIAKFNDLFREPFGEPSALQRSLSSAEATVDSIINMYDDLIQTITERFEGIEPARRDELINFLTDQTAALVALARKRATAVEVLKEAQDELDDLLSDQVAFQNNLTSSLKSFATAIANLSQTDSATTLKVIKTATGLVVTQLQQSSSGIDKITKQLQDRLRTIRDFGNNIRTLLASGLNRDYIKQLLEAGPEAAGLTAAALATAGADQISEINNLYAEIDSMSNSFGRDMAVVFYQNAVDMATAFRDGAAAEVQSITDQMTAIRVSIETALAPLRDMAANLGEDTMQVLLDSIKKRKGEVLAEIQDLVNKIAELMAAAARSIGVEVTSKPGQVAPSGGGFVTPTGVQKNVILEDIANTTADLKRLQDKLAAGGLGPKALENLKQNIDIRKQVLKDLRSELGTATSPTPPSSGIPKSSVPGVTNVNSGAVQITVTNNGATGELAVEDIQSAVTEGMLAALDGRRMVAV